MRLLTKVYSEIKSFIQKIETFQSNITHALYLVTACVTPGIAVCWH